MKNKQKAMSKDNISSKQEPSNTDEFIKGIWKDGQFHQNGGEYDAFIGWNLTS